MTVTAVVAVVVAVAVDVPVVVEWLVDVWQSDGLRDVAPRSVI